MSATRFRPTVIEEPPRPPHPSTRGLELLAWLMDRAIRVPGTKITVGLDALLGLLPVGGDFLTGLIQVGIVLVALYKYRVPRAVAARMAANVLLDTVLGALPILGDAFDVFFKANTRNLKLLNQVQEQRSLNQPVSSIPSVLYLAGLTALMLLVLGLILVGFITIVAWVVRHI
jgi:Domain of unknown function (DUF4112)